jgi:hypothetical protein
MRGRGRGRRRCSNLWCATARVLEALLSYSTLVFLHQSAMLYLLLPLIFLAFELLLA